MMKLFTKPIDVSPVSHSIVLQSLPFLTVLINLQSMYITFAELLLRPNIQYQAKLWHALCSVSLTLVTVFLLRTKGLNLFQVSFFNCIQTD